VPSGETANTDFIVNSLLDLQLSQEISINILYVADGDDPLTQDDLDLYLSNN